MTAPQIDSEFQVLPSWKVARPAIEVSSLVKTYGAVRALDGLSFSVEAGTIFVLLGPHGAGKSTAVKILNTLVRPDFGSAVVAGVDVLLEPAHVRRVIGCVAQKSGVELESTGRENLVLQGQLYGLRGGALKSRVAELLERFCLAEAAHLPARSYSGGMLRKLDIAMGLIHQPQVLFLDEPTTGLDSEARLDLWDEVSRLARRDGVTILLTTRDLEEADRLAKRLAIVDRGKLVVTGSAERLKRELFGDSVHVELPAPEPAGKVRIALERVGGFQNLVFEGRSLRIRTPHGAKAVPGIVGALELEGIKATSVQVSRPSLDDVYLKYTGRTFSEANSGAAG